MPARTTASRIASAARRLLNTQGAEAVTMRRVAAAVGVTPMAIYRHYPDRASLLNALANEGFAGLAARLAAPNFTGGSNAEDRLTKMMEIYLDHALQKPRLFELMFLKPREGARSYPRDFKTGQSPTANLLFEAVQSGMNSGHFRKADAWEIVFEMGALSHGLLLLYLGRRMETSRAQFRAFYRRSFRRFIHGIRK
jgi:AcrR family transcriptional regulator